jgi:hypothetical protein
VAHPLLSPFFDILKSLPTISRYFPLIKLYPMVRTSIRSYGEPMGISPVPFEVSGTPRQDSIWRPALRRIRRGPFSNKFPQEPDGKQTEPNYILLNLPHNGVSQQWSNNMELATISFGDRVISRHMQPRGLDTNTPQERSIASREPNQSRGFSFIKRSLSKSKQRPFISSDVASLVTEQERRIERKSEPEKIRPTSAI